MKFTDGQWMLQPGVAAHYATEAYAVQVFEDRLVVLATTRPIKHRGDTLQGPTLTITISSPLAGAVRISVEHFSASQPPRSPRARSRSTSRRATALASSSARATRC